MTIISSRDGRLNFPDSGLEYLESVNFKVKDDTLRVGGLSRLSAVKLLTFRGVDGYKMKAWPRGVYLNGGVTSFNIANGGVTGIDDSLALLKNLNFLNVAVNEISSLPEWLYQRQKFSILVFDNRLCTVDSVQTNWLNSHAESWNTQRCP